MVRTDVQQAGRESGVAGLARNAAVRVALPAANGESRVAHLIETIRSASEPSWSE